MIKMNYEIYNVHRYNYPYLVHKKIDHWSIWGKEDSKIKLCFSGKARNWIKNPTKNIRRQLHSIPYFCKQKDSCYTKVLQKFMAKPHNFLLRLKSPHKVIKHITTENIHKIVWKVYCFELSSYCTPLPPPPPPKCAPDFEGQMANFPREFLEHHHVNWRTTQRAMQAFQGRVLYYDLEFFVVKNESWQLFLLLKWQALFFRSPNVSRSRSFNFLTWLSHSQLTGQQSYWNKVQTDFFLNI